MKKHKLASPESITLRSHEQPGSLTIEQWLSSVHDAPPPARAKIEMIQPGAVLKYRDGSCWRVNSMYAPTGFCLIEECNSQGTPMERYTALSVNCFVEPYWSLVSHPRSAHRFIWMKWLDNVKRWLHV